jgi:hypothetical protein
MSRYFMKDGVVKRINGDVNESLVDVEITRLYKKIEEYYSSSLKPEYVLSVVDDFVENTSKFRKMLDLTNNGFVEIPKPEDKT